MLALTWCKSPFLVVLVHSCSMGLSRSWCTLSCLANSLLWTWSRIVLSTHLGVALVFDRNLIWISVPCWAVHWVLPTIIESHVFLCACAGLYQIILRWLSWSIELILRSKWRLTSCLRVITLSREVPTHPTGYNCLTLIMLHARWDHLLLVPSTNC